MHQQVSPRRSLYNEKKKAVLSLCLHNYTTMNVILIPILARDYMYSIQVWFFRLLNLLLIWGGKKSLFRNYFVKAFFFSPLFVWYMQIVALWFCYSALASLLIQCLYYNTPDSEKLLDMLQNSNGKSKISVKTLSLWMTGITQQLQRKYVRGEKKKTLCV